MKEQRIKILQKLKNDEITLTEADEELSFLYGTNNLFLGEDSEGNQIQPNDMVLRDQKFKETIDFGKYREKFDCGYIIGYYVPDHCKVIT